MVLKLTTFITPPTGFERPARSRHVFRGHGERPARR
ncbi:hypothetical protein ACSSVZ_000435 [Amorphus sp. MBR-141]